MNTELHSSDVWKLFGFQHDETTRVRDEYRAEMRLRLGPEMASEVERHVDVALGRVQSDLEPTPKVMVTREFYHLLGLEMAIAEVESRINATAARLADTNSTYGQTVEHRPLSF